MIAWIQHNSLKVDQTEVPGAGAEIVLNGLRYGHESVQVVVNPDSDISDVDVVVSELTGPAGATIPVSAWTLYRVNYVDCDANEPLYPHWDYGWLPDSMVPFLNPNDGSRIGGQYGAPFDAVAEQNIPIWLELWIPNDIAAGLYTGTVSVTAGGVEQQSIPIQLTVHAARLAPETELLTYMSLAYTGGNQDLYWQLLHEHRVDFWNLQDIPQPSYNATTGQMNFSDEYDAYMEAYFDGTLFDDGIPAKTYLFGYSNGNTNEYLKAGGQDRINILTAYEARYKDKWYAAGIAWFIYDEPDFDNPEKPWVLPNVIQLGEDIKQYSPSFGLLLTAAWREELSGLVDIWDSIINFEIVAYGTPGPQPLRDEIAAGRSAINNITVNSNESISPNLFIPMPAMNSRIWCWATHYLGHDGIEFWETKPAPSVTEPKRYNGAWGDGSLMYKGLPAELGIADEIALPALRMKYVMHSIEDYEMLNMLGKSNATEANRLRAKMAMDLADYVDGTYEQPVKYIKDYWSPDGNSDLRDAPGHLVFEASVTRLEAARAEIMTALAGGVLTPSLSNAKADVNDSGAVVSCSSNFVPVDTNDGKIYVVSQQTPLVGTEAEKAAYIKANGVEMPADYNPSHEFTGQTRDTVYYDAWVQEYDVDEGVPPVAVSDLTATIAGQYIQLAWSHVPGATSYRLERSADGITYTANVVVTGPAFLDEFGNAGTLYYYRVFAINTEGTSPESNVVSETMPVAVGRDSDRCGDAGRLV